jgi:hypothetical protein
VFGDGEFGEVDVVFGSGDEVHELTQFGLVGDLSTYTVHIVNHQVKHKALSFHFISSLQKNEDDPEIHDMKFWINILPRGTAPTSPRSKLGL